MDNEKNNELIDKCNSAFDLISDTLQLSYLSDTELLIRAKMYILAYEKTQDINSIHIIFAYMALRNILVPFKYLWLIDVWDQVPEAITQSYSAMIQRVNTEAEDAKEAESGDLIGT